MGTTANKLQLNSTQIPNIILDEWMPVLTPAEFKVVMTIARQTYGWQKESDRISYSQIIEKTGYEKEAVSTALKSLRKSGKVIVTDSEGTQLNSIDECRGKSLYYKLNLFENRTSEIEHTKETNTKALDLSTKDTNGANTQSEVIEKKEYGDVNINQALAFFTKVTELDRPSDKNPRHALSTFFRTKKPDGSPRTLEDFRGCLSYCWEDKGYELTSISAVHRHFSEYSKHRKQTVETSTPEPFRGFNI